MDIDSPLYKDAHATASTLVPLKVLPPRFLEELLHYAELQMVFAGQTVCEQGTFDGQHLYLQHGKVELQYSSGYTETINAGDYLLPIAHRQPRPCRVVAISDCTFIRFDSSHLDRILSWSQISDYLLTDISLQRDLDEDVEWMQTILNSNLFFKVPPVNVEQIFSRLTTVVVNSGETIICQGEMGNCCYFIKEGSAEVTIREEGVSQPKKVAEISVGRCFGEDALLNQTVRNASVTMTSDAVLMRLEKNDFLLLLKEPVVDELTEKEIGELFEEPVLIDVRTDDEYSFGHLAYSANLPLGLLSMKKKQLAMEKPYIFYCDTGKRSRAAAYLLGKQGYNTMALKDGVNLAGMDDHFVKDECYILRDGSLVAGQ